MRTIKFRAWDKKRKEMLEVKDLSWRINSGCTSKSPSEIGASDFGDYDEVTYLRSIADGWELMQFTGLLDRHGKDIYEGDIVKEDIFKRNHKVSWSEHWDNEGSYEDYTGGNGFYLEDIKGEKQYNDYVSNASEVIGNIYENPELLIK